MHDVYTLLILLLRDNIFTNLFQRNTCVQINKTIKKLATCTFEVYTKCINVLNRIHGLSKWTHRI